MASTIPIQPQSVTERKKGWVVAHEPGTDILHAGQMEIIAWAVPPPDHQEPEWENCGETYENCLFVAGRTGRRCGLDFFIRRESVLHPIKLKEDAVVTCGQRPAVKER